MLGWFVILITSFFLGCLIILAIFVLAKIFDTFVSLILKIFSVFGFQGTNTIFDYKKDS